MNEEKEKMKDWLRKLRDMPHEKKPKKVSTKDEQLRIATEKLMQECFKK